MDVATHIIPKYIPLFPNAIPIQEQQASNTLILARGINVAHYPTDWAPYHPVRLTTLLNL